MALTDEDREEIRALIVEAQAAAVAAAVEATEDADSPAEAVDELAEEVAEIAEEVAEEVEEVVTGEPADTITDPSGNDDDLPDIIEQPLDAAGVDVTPDPDPDPDPVVEVAGVAPVVVDTAPAREHPYWRKLRR